MRTLRGFYPLLRTLVSPSILAMDRLRYRPKLALIGFVFLVPLAVITWFFIAEIDTKIAQIQRERVGVRYERAAQALLRATIDHESGLLQQSAGQRTDRRGEDSDAALANALLGLRAIHEKEAVSLNVESRFQEVQGAVQQLVGTRQGAKAPSTASHVVAIGAIKALIDDVSENSELVLDVRYDSYYVTDAVLNNGSELMRSTSQVQALMAEAIGSKDRMARNRTALAYLESRLRDSEGALADDLNRLLGHNPRIGRSLSVPFARLDAQLDRLTSLLASRSVGEPAASPASSDPIAGASLLMASTDSFGRDGLDVLDSLLADRLNSHLSRRAEVFGIDLFFLALALYGFAGFYFSTTRTVRSLVAAGRGVRAHCEVVRSLASRRDTAPVGIEVESVTLETRDELRELGLMMVDLIHDLSAAVGDYTHSQHEMFVAKEEAERANRAKSDFLSRMSHELRTPLNSIMGFAQVLEMEGLPDPQRESVQLILRSSKHLLAMINEILDLARIEIGELGMSVEALPIGHLIREAVAIIEPLAEARNVKIAFSSPIPEELCVKSDRRRLLQVCLNLLSNAVKYNRTGGSVMVSIGERDKRVVVEISDTGLGIEGENLDNLFSPFARLGRERSDVEGTGLGLALSQGLIQSMGGRLRYRPNVPQGSVFSFDLEAAELPVAAVPEPIANSLIELSDWPQAKRILLIEDNIANVELLRRVFEFRPKASLLVAMKGALGIELAQQNPPDLIILDLNLPDIPGSEVLSVLRAESRTAEVPVMVVSADATQQQTALLNQAGVVDYITKPLDIRKFLQAVDHILGEVLVVT